MEAPRDSSAKAPSPGRRVAPQGFGRAEAPAKSAEAEAYDALVAKKEATLKKDIDDVAPPAYTDAPKGAAPKADAKPAKRETPAWVTYKAPADPRANRAPEPEPEAEPTFTITPKRDDPSLAATSQFFKDFNTKKGVARSSGAASKPFGKAEPKAPAPETEAYDALSSKVSGRYD